MPNPKLATPQQRATRQRQRALKKQARRTFRRREKIMAGLTDRFTATMLDATDARLVNADDAHVPLALLPTRQLRRRVAELNRETAALHLALPSPETGSRPDPACLISPVAKEGGEPPEAVDGGRHAVARTHSVTPVRHPRRRGRRPSVRRRVSPPRSCPPCPTRKGPCAPSSISAPAAPSPPAWAAATPVPAAVTPTTPSTRAR